MGEYGFNIVYALIGAPSAKELTDPANKAKWDANVGNQVANLATQANLLTFISETVATSTPLGLTLGNAAATFVQQSFGNVTLATKFAPFLEALNLPSTPESAFKFLSAVGKNGVNATLLSTFKPVQAQQALITFFTDPVVQGILKDATTSAVKVLLGLQSASWTGAPQPPANAVADYLGEMGAEKLLGDGSPFTQSLAGTISGAITGLIGNIGPTVADDAGQALVTLLNWTPTLVGQLDAPTVLADFTVNSLFNALQAGCQDKGDCKESGVPNPPLLPSLAPAAGDAVAGLVDSLLTDSAVLQGLGTFVNDLVPGVLDNQGVQEEISARITGTLGSEFGTPIADTVLGLLNDPTVTGALTAFVNTTVGTFLGADGVVSELADAAGVLVTARLADPVTFADVLKQVEADLKVNPSIDAGVDAGVTAGSAGLLGNTEFWDAVNNSVATLVSTLLTDPTAQSGLAALVSAQVASRFKSEAIGQFVGDQVGTLVVEVLTNPVVEQGLYGVVDTLLADFWQAQGVASAFSVAFGALAAAKLAGDYDEVYPEVLASLQTNQQVEDALANSFGAAVTDFLGDSNLWSAVDGTVSAAVIELTTDPTALGLLNQAVQDAVTERLGEPLASVVGPQIGDAVVSLVSNPAVAPALLGVVDTLVADFFGTAGVVDAFAGAAGTWALVLFTTFNPGRARELAQQQLRFSDAVATGVDVAVTEAVAELLGDTGLWAAVDQTVSSLAVTLLGDVEVQQAIQQQVADQVELRVTGDLGVFLGEQLGTLVVELVTNPTIQTGLLGVVDTLAVDFWTTPGVVTAFSEAAGALAYGWLTGDPNATPEAVQADLQANPAVQAGVQNSVGAAVTELLSDSNLWSAVDGTLSAAVINLTTNPVALAGLEDAVSAQVQIALGEPLGSVVGPQVGAAVAQLVSDPAVAPALLGVVDTLFADFFGTSGVVAAFSAAASEFALVLVTGGDRPEAEAAARQILQDSDAVATGVDASVTAAVAELLGDAGLWGAVAQSVSSLAVTLLGDVEIQTLLHDRVADAVELRVTGDLGVFLGDQLGNLVVALVTNPTIQTGFTAAVDTLVSEFWTTPGVVTAFSEAAGALAYGALTGDPDATPEKITADLQANPDVQAGV
ncbi:MAG: hypothetical protein KIH64_005905, partial [Mycobacterium sp.]|nr:hypothetical protein [Mycobacterium sp.]